MRRALKRTSQNCQVTTIGLSPEMSVMHAIAGCIHMVVSSHYMGLVLTGLRSQRTAFQFVRALLTVLAAAIG